MVQDRHSYNGRLIDTCSAVDEMGDRLATIDMGGKWMAALPLSVGGGLGHLLPSNTMWTWAEAYLRTKWHLNPSNRLATVHQRYRQDRQDNGPVA